MPLLVEKGLISLSAVTKFDNGVTKNSNGENHYFQFDDENKMISAQNQSLRRDFPCDSTLLDSRPSPYQVLVTYY